MMEYYAIHIPKKTDEETESVNVFTDREEALKLLKSHKEARLKAFKNEQEAEEFSLCGKLTQNINVTGLKSPSSLPIAAEKSVHRSLTPQQLVAFRKEIEQKNLSIVHQMVMSNPRYLVSCANTPTILKEGTRYNALHVAIIAKDLNMCKLVLQTVEKKEFIELLNGMPQDALSLQEASSVLLDSYLNMPDKPRSETPLHFASKLGLKEIVELLISYPICKMKPNNEGNLPKDIICQRCTDGTPELKKSIDNLLQERYYVPVLRAVDSTIPPVIGEPFSTSNPPKIEGDRFSPQMEIKAYAGPMNQEQAQVFKRRWKTPPRLIPSKTQESPYQHPGSPYKQSPIPQASPLLSPTKIRHNTLNNNYSSTPLSTRGRRLFSEEDKFDDSDEDKTPLVERIEDLKNGNVKSHTIDETLKTITTKNNDITPVTPNNGIGKVSDLVNRFFQEYRDDKINDSSILDTSMPNLNQSYNFYCEETSSIYNPANVITSSGAKERLVRIADPEKGLEMIGRELAKNQNIGWKEHWKFLNAFVDLASTEGLDLFEKYLTRKENKSSPTKSPISSNNDSMFDLCAGFNTLQLNKEETPRIKHLNAINKFVQEYRNLKIPIANNNHINNPYLSIEKALQTYAKRTSLSLAQNSNDSINILEQESKKLKSTLLSYCEDTRFMAVNLKKSHSRYAHLTLWYLENEELPGNKSSKQVIQTIKATQNTNSETKCVLKFLIKTSLIVNPNSISSEQDCIEAWNKSEECLCVLMDPRTSDERVKQMRRKRRELRLGLWQKLNEKEDIQKLTVPQDDLWKARSVHNITDDLDNTISSEGLDDEEYYSCDSDFEASAFNETSEDLSDNCFITPPESPTDFESVYENSDEFLDEDLEEFCSYTNYIEGDAPTKADIDAFRAIRNVNINETEYPHILKWKQAIEHISHSDYESSHTSITFKPNAFFHNTFKKS